MSGKKTPTKGATVVEEKKKLLQQYKDDDGHFSLVR
jgi:CDP-diacylglycerol--serine O-phosphatidyltransferase